jgi:hypothetical protein
MADERTLLIDALIACGVDNVTLFKGETAAQRIADDILDNLFTKCKDMTFKELDDHFKTYSELSVAQGQIRVRPGMRKNIKAFVQWTRDKLQLGCDPSASVFPINQVSDFSRRYKTHKKYQTDSKTLAEAAKTDKLKESVKWDDWKPTFLNYICAIPGCDGVPLKYICQKR